MNSSDLIMIREIISKCVKMQETDWGRPLDAYCYALLTRIDCSIEKLIEEDYKELVKGWELK